MNNREAKREAQRTQNNREELVERMARILPEDGFSEPFPGLFLVRSSVPSEPFLFVHQPAFCFVAQGSKRALVGEELFRYDAGHYLIFTVDLPVIFQVEEASEERPYFGLRVDLDPTIVASIMIESDFETKKSDGRVRAIDVSPVDADLLDAVVRLVRFLDTPNRRKIIAPLIIREIIYLLLAGGQGARLGHLFASGGDARRISSAIGHLVEHFNEPLKIEYVARQVGMSVSGFHYHFKSVTSMSPLQFQKQIRLYEARRLMLSEDMDAASAGHRVGYGDPSYFNRDYKKLFGTPPHRDLARLRGALKAGGVSARV